MYDAMLPGQRTASTLGLLLDDAPAEVGARLLADLLGARDVPGALPSLYRALGEDPAREADTDGVRLVAADRAKKGLANAATAVLRHRETYAIAEGGLLHYVLYDLRRVSGTTDVEEGAQAAGALVEGRDVRRTLRRRIHKPDGRILEPDRASYASQGHADLSQLQKGDYVELAVTDRRPGILEDERKRIFDRFERGSQAQKGGVRGSGIGLALVSHIAEAHGGSAWVESVLPHGSRFVFSVRVRGGVRRGSSPE